MGALASLRRARSHYLLYLSFETLEVVLVEGAFQIVGVRHLTVVIELSHGVHIADTDAHAWQGA